MGSSFQRGNWYTFKKKSPEKEKESSWKSTARITFSSDIVDSVDIVAPALILVLIGRWERNDIDRLYAEGIFAPKTLSTKDFYKKVDAAMAKKMPLVDTGPKGSKEYPLLKSRNHFIIQWTRKEFQGSLYYYKGFCIIKGSFWKLIY